ncbi:MAG: hypothetical protein R3F37_03710 [Candidatus Competibacteraceae bacterium]
MARKEHIWVIDDDHSIRWVLEKALQRENMTVTTFESGMRWKLRKGEPV